MPRADADNYAGPLLKELRGLRGELKEHLGAASLAIVDRTIRFLDRRLTDAAKAGCHHCDDVQERGGPCWWCGLKKRGR